MKRLWARIFLSLHLDKLCLACTLISSAALAQNVPANFNISGGLFSSTGVPIVSSNVNFNIEILDAGAACVLYSERHLAVDLSNTKGAFSILVGGGTSPVNNLEGTALFDTKLFQNSGAVAAFTGCPAGVTLAPGDNRLIRVSYDLGGGYVAMTPNVPITSAAYAMVAETLQGKATSDFILGNLNSSLRQANVEYIFSNLNYPNLKALVDGTSSQYILATPTANVGFNSKRLINIADPSSPQDAATKNYADTFLGGKSVDVTGVGVGVGGGRTLIWDQVANKWVTSSTGAVGLVAAGVGLNGGNITTSGTLSVDVGTTANKILQLNASAQIPAVDGSLLMNVNAVQLQARAVSAVAPAAGQVIAWNMLTALWEPTTPSGGTITALTGDVAASGSGSVTATIQPNAVTAAKINNTGVAVNRLLITDATTGATVGYSTCALGELLQWTALGWACKPVATMLGTTGVVVGTYGNATQVPQVTVDAQGRVTSLTNVNIAFPVTSVAGRTGAVVLTAADITTGLGTAAAQNVGTGVNNVVQLAVAGQLPALDGFNLTNVNANATKLQSRNVAATLPTAGQVLGWNISASQWEPVSTSSGSVTSVVGGAGLLGGNITSTGTLTVDTGTTANKILQLNASAQIPAVDGSLVTNVNAGKIIGKLIGAVAPTSGQVLTYNNLSAQWEAAAVAASAGSFVNGGNSFGANSTLGNGDNFKLSLLTNNSARMTIDGAGNVGIGTTSSLNALDVNGGMAIGTYAGTQVAPTNGLSVSGPVAIGQPDAYGAMLAVMYQGSNSSLINGITVVNGNHGSDGPVLTFLHAYDTWGALTNGDTIGGLEFKGADSANTRFLMSRIRSDVTDVTAGSVKSNIVFTTSNASTPADQMIINHLGYVGIGTATPNALLDVAGTMRVTTICDSAGGNCKTVSSGWGAGGSVTNVSAGAGLLGGNIGTTGTLSVDVGTGANQIMQLNASAQIRAVDGSLVTNVNAAKIGTRTVSSAVPSAGQFIGWNSLSSQWEPIATTTGTVTTVNAGNGLLGGPITNNGTLTVDVGTTANKILQLNASAQIPAVDGSQITNINAGKIIGKSIGAVAPTAGQVLTYNNLSSLWEASNAGTSSQWNNGASSSINYLAGNVGIGTTTPNSTLDVMSSNSSGYPIYMEGSATSGAGLYMNATAAGGHAFGIYSSANGSSTGGGNFVIKDFAAGAHRLLIDPNGNVGIGTTSPGSLLDVELNQNAVTTVAVGNTNTGTSAGAQFQATSSQGTVAMGIFSPANTNGSEAYVWNSANTALNFGTNNTYAMGIAANGNIAVGATGSSLAQFTTSGGSLATSAIFGSNGTGVAIWGGGPGYYPGISFNSYLDNTTTTRALNAGYASEMMLNEADGSVQFYTGGGSYTAGQATSMALSLNLSQNGNVGIGTASPQVILDVGTTTSGQSAIIVPRDTAANRPAGVNGMIRYNTNAAALEAFANGTWSSLAGAGAGGVYLPLAGGTLTGPLLNANGSSNNPSLSFANSPGSGLYRYGADAIGFSAAGSNQMIFGAGYLQSTTAFGPWLNLGAVGAGTPAYSFNGDTQTGMFRPAANTVALATAGNERLRVNSSGNVGIGTTSPGYILDINLGSGIGNNNDTTLGTSIFGDAGGSQAFLGNRYVLNNNNGNVTGFFRAARTAGNTYFGMEFGSETHGVRFLTGGSADANERMRITPTGNVGIGTTTPNAILDVATTTSGQSAIIVPRDTAANRPPSGVNGMIRYNTSTSKFEAFENNSWTNVIGAGTTSFPLLANPIGTAGAPAYSFTSDSNTGMYSPASDNIAFATNGVARLAIDQLGNIAIGTASQLFVSNTGNVGIGTTNPKTTLNLGGTSFSSGGLSFGTAGDTGIYYDGSYLTFRQAGTDRVFMNGNILQLGIGNAPEMVGAGNVQFQVHSGEDTGIGWDAAGILGIYAGGTERMTVKGANVGIGTTSPNAILDIATTLSGQSAIIVPRDTAANRPPSGVNGMIRYNTNNSAFEGFANGIWGALASSGGTSAGASGSIQYGNGAGGFLSNNNIVVDGANGRVGIGTAAPKEVLDVNGSILISADNEGLTYNTRWSSPNSLSIYNGSGFIVQHNGSSNNLEFQAAHWTAAGNVQTYQDAINISQDAAVGIGNATVPAAPLHLDSGNATATDLKFTAGTTTGQTATDGYDVGIDSSGNAELRQRENLELRMFTNNTQRLTIQNSGNVGVGTTTPQALLDIATTTSGQSAILIPRDTAANRPATGVNGMIRYNTNAAAFEGFSNGTWGSLGSGGTSQWNNGASSSINYLAGNVGIGTTTPAAPLHVTKSQNATTSILSENLNAGALAESEFLAKSNAGTVEFGIGSSALSTSAMPGAAFIWNNAGTGLAINPGGPLAVGMNGGGTGPYQIYSYDYKNTGPGRPTIIGNWISAGMWGVGPATTANDNTIRIGNIANTATDWAATQNLNLVIGGNLGIGLGTTSPAGLIDVQSVATNGLTGLPINLQAQPTSASSGASTGGGINISAGVSSGVGGTGGSVTITAGTALNGAGASGGNILLMPGAGNLKSGNVGIGTLTPLALLDLSTTTSGQSAIIIPRDTAANRPTGVNGMLRYNTNSAAFEGFANGAWGSLAGAGGASQWLNNSSDIYFNTGKVGIGTSAPSGTFSVVGNSGGASMTLQNTNNSAWTAIDVYAAGGSQVGSFGYGNPGSGTTSLIDHMYVGSNAAKDFVFFTNGPANERMRITSAGNVGIGMTTPSDRLEVNGGLRVGQGPVAATTLNGAVLAGDTSITVVSTAGYPSSGTLSVDGEAIAYTGSTATTFTGLTRGVFGTAPSSHVSGHSVPNYLFAATPNSSSSLTLYALSSGAAGVGPPDTNTNAGAYSFAVGETVQATGNDSFATGNAQSTAEGQSSVAMGGNAYASGSYSAAIGAWNAATGYVSIALGNSSVASGDNSAAIGEGATAAGFDQVAVGAYNITGGENPNTWVNSDPIFVVGNGTGAGARSNAVTVLKNGQVGIGTTTPGAKLDVNGEIKLGNTSSTCNSTNEGQQRYNSTTKQMEFCNGTIWAGFGSGNSAVIPLSTVVAYAGASAPTGWLLCDGQEVSRTTYSALFAIIGTYWGPGDGSTTFNVPDLRGRVLAHANPAGANGLNPNAAGVSLGSEYHTISINEMPAHNHTLALQNGGAAGSSGNALAGNGATNANETSASRGSGNPMSLMQPTVYINYIIFTGN